MLLLRAKLYGPQAAEPLPPAVIKAIAKELKDLQEKPEEGIKVWLQPSVWKVLLQPLRNDLCMYS